MERMKVSKSIPGIKKIIKSTFPNYKGRTVYVDNYIPSKLDSYWEGGSISYYAFYNLASGEAFHVHSNHPFFEADKPRETPELPKNVVVVEHCIFCGKDLGIRIHVNLTPNEMQKQLTQNTVNY